MAKKSEAKIQVTSKVDKPVVVKLDRFAKETHRSRAQMIALYVEKGVERDETNLATVK